MGEINVPISTEYRCAVVPQGFGVDKSVGPEKSVGTAFASSNDATGRTIKPG